MHSFLKLVRSQAIAVLALLLALSGGAYAVRSAAKNSVTSRSIRNGNVQTADLRNGAVTAPKLATNAVSGAKVKDDSLTGADVVESTLGQVPSAASADSAGSAGSALTAQVGGLVWESPQGSCTPTTADYGPCTTTTLTMPAGGTLVLVGQAGLSHRSDNQYQAEGRCAYSVNGTLGTPTVMAKPAGTFDAGYAVTVPVIDAVTVPAGPVTVSLSCKDLYYSKFTDVRFLAMAASTP